MFSEVLKSMNEIRAEIKKHNIVYQILKEPVDFNSINVTNYIEYVQKMQKKLNIELTKTVEHEKIGEAIQDEDIVGLEDSDDDVPTYTTKRKLSHEKNEKKVKK
ncbi:hypothetical protein FQA39_LY15415 [Lamprigera yunnana]|nr:hypothetical protein FQA39_LY15415 [Lamprigera yunnana]